MSNRRTRLIVAALAIAAICYAVAELSQTDFEKALTARIRRLRR